MEIQPPIPVPDRTTEQLLNVVETRERWRQEVVDMAQRELTKRGISIQTQEKRRNNRTKFHKKIEEIKAQATYTTLEKILIVLLGPMLIAVLDNP